MISEDTLLEALRSHAGIDAAQTGEASLRKDIRRAINACPHPKRLLDTSSREWKALLESALVPETWFFRNMEAFDALAEWAAGTWFPARPGACLRVLSLPCATGEEPFSITMRLLESGLAPGCFKVRAGDISENSLAVARAADYGRNSFRSGFDESRFGKYFCEHRGGVRRVSDEIRRMVDFQVMNLADPSAMLPQSDVIFCRNALIYFSGETQRTVVSRLRGVLSDGGLLFLGPVEPPVALQCGFATAGFPMAFACMKNVGAAESLPRIHAASRPARSRPVSPKPVLTSRAKPSARLHSPPPVGKPQDSLDAARSLGDAGEEAAAAAMLDRMAAPADPDFFCLRGVVNGALGRSDLAEADYRRALYLDPSHHEALAHLALLLELDGRAPAAARMRRRANKDTAPV